MEKSKIDPLFIQFSKQTEILYISVHLKVNKSEFTYKDLEVSNDNQSPRFLKFVEEINFLFQDFPQSYITKYLCNVSVLEATIHITDAKKIMTSLKLSGVSVLLK